MDWWPRGRNALPLNQIWDRNNRFHITNFQSSVLVAYRCKLISWTLLNQNKFRWPRLLKEVKIYPPYRLAELVSSRSANQEVAFSVLYLVWTQEANTRRECCSCMASRQIYKTSMGISSFNPITVNNEIKELWLAWNIVDCVLQLLCCDRRFQAISTIFSPSVFRKNGLKSSLHEQERYKQHLIERWETRPTA